MSQADRRPLGATLAALSFDDLRARVGIRPLLAGAGGDIRDQDIDTCCSCKIPDRDLEHPDDADGDGDGDPDGDG
jgi:hypothetical protein